MGHLPFAEVPAYQKRSGIRGEDRVEEKGVQLITEPQKSPRRNSDAWGIQIVRSKACSDLIAKDVPEIKRACSL